MHPSSTSVTSMIPASLPSQQHVMPSAYNNSSNPVCWSTTSSSTAGGAATAADNVIISNGNTFQHHPPPPALQREDIKEVEMKPLDLSLRPPRQQSENPNNNINNTSSWPRISTPSSSRSGSQRLSPYPILSQSSGSLSSSPSYRHLGSPNLSQSRSPLARSISPYYPYHRQTPSPYYLSGSCTPPDNCSSLQVLSSTNRLLNALSSVSTSQLRSYDDSSSSPAPSDLMSVCEPTRMMKDPETSNRRHHHHHHHHHQQQQQQLQQQNNSNREVDIEVESEEPTYIDMDSSTTVVKSVSSSRQVQHHPGNIHGMSSSMYAGTTVMSSSSSTNNFPMSHHQTPLPTSQPHLRHHDDLSSASSSNHPGVAVTTTGRSPPHELQSYHHHHQPLQQRPHPHPHQAADSRDYLQSSVTSCPPFISNDLQMSSSSISVSSPSPLRSPPSSHTMHLCDSSNQGITTSSRDDSGRSSSSSSSSSSYPFYHNENPGSTAAPTSTLASNPAVDYVRDIRMDHQDNRNQQQKQQQQQHQTPTVVKEMLDSQQQLQQHQNPDSSSSPSAVRDSSSYSVSSYSSTPSSSSSHWRASSTNAELISPGNSNNSTSTISGNSPISSHQRPPSPQMSPDSNISRSALSILQSPSSNKENIRFINCGSTAALSRSSNTSNASTIVNGGGSGGGAPVSTGSTTARRSFFQIDKSLLEENGGSALLADDAASQNGDSSRCSVLDFWISKILMEETPRRRCGADIRHTVDGNKRIRLRLVDLIELQVEQSLLKA